MSKLDIDNKGNIVIYKEHNDSGISFLLEEFFDNSLSKLKADIKVCQDTNKRDLLIYFAEKYQNGEFDFISDYWQNDESEDSANSSVEFGFNRDGMRQFIANNVIAIHSGFWYAADNIDNELKNISCYKHNYEGYKIAVNNIDLAISLIKDATTYDSALNGLREFGMTHAQAEALMSVNINTFAAYDVKQLQKKN